MPKNAIVVTGCDSAHFDLAEDLATSFRFHYKNTFDFAFINFCDVSPPEGLLTKTDMACNLSGDYNNFDKNLGFYAAFTAVKTRLPDLFPGYKIYCWIDSDCWVQNSESLMRIIYSAEIAEIAIHPEFDVHYLSYPTPNPRTLMIYSQNEAGRLNEMPLHMPMLNAGVFGMKSSSRLWKLWQNELNNLVKRFQLGETVYFSDQIALHKLIYAEKIMFLPLRAVDNWQTYACPPFVHFESGKLRVPSPPFEEIGLLHLAGTTKDKILTTSTGIDFTLRYRDIKRIFKIV
jgi:hypothetical protein